MMANIIWYLKWDVNGLCAACKHLFVIIGMEIKVLFISLA